VRKAFIASLVAARSACRSDEDDDDTANGFKFALLPRSEWAGLAEPPLIFVNCESNDEEMAVRLEAEQM
jgi:hypothetical protein